MNGAVSADGREPLLSLPLLVGASGASRSDSEAVAVLAVLDTGFDGELQLPPALVR